MSFRRRHRWTRRFLVGLAFGLLVAPAQAAGPGNGDSATAAALQQVSDPYLTDIPSRPLEATSAAGPDGTTPATPVEVVPAAHETLSPEFAGFVVFAGPYCIYHSGDTIRYSGMEERLRRYPIDLALLPINGRSPERRVSGNLSGPEAAQLAHAIGARWVLPCHYEMFAFNTATPDAFVSECKKLGQPHAVLRAGERWQLPPADAKLPSP